MPLSRATLVLVWSLLLTSLSPLATQAASLFRGVPLSASNMIGDGIAIFTPEGTDPATLPPSPSLLATPRITGELPERWSPRPSFQTDGTRFQATIAVEPGTDLYGSGEVTGPLRRNGTSIKLWNSDNFNYKDDEGRRLYQSHPWILGLRKDGTAYGVIFDSSWKAELSCYDHITFTCEGPAFPVYVINRKTPADVLAGLAELTGTMPLPPLWALGYQQCRWSYQPDSRVREIADEFRKRKIPCDVLWMDIDYMDAFRIFTFRHDEFPDPTALNNYLHSNGYKSVWMIDPGVKKDPGYSVYDSGTKADVWVKDANGEPFVGSVWPGPCVFPDFTNPDVRDWWGDLYTDFMAKGVDGVWNDMNEPSVFDSPSKTMPADNLHRGGGGLPAGPHLQYHNLYGMLMARASREGILQARPDARPFLLTRSNFLGGQRYAATWTGDNASTKEHMKLSIPMSLSLGLSGQPFNGPDLGGFSEDPAPALWSEWVSMGAFFPFCRGHAVKGSKNKEPWAFGKGVETSARIALSRRYRLLPYYYTLFEEASRTGMPVMRPLFLADTTNLSLRKEENSFLIGDALMVTPRWAAAKKPLLPKGVWREISLVNGDKEDKTQAILQMREGSIIPLGRLVQSTAETLLEPLTLLVCPDKDGHATGMLYEDAGDGFGYQKGEFLRTKYVAQVRGKDLEVSVESAEGRLPRPPRKVIIEVVDQSGQHLQTTTWYL